MKQPILLTLWLICALCFPWATLAADDERQVVVTGVGLNEEEAKRQAYRNAVQSVVGAMVVAETLVENEALVRDKVLSHSDGYITKVEQMGQSVALEGGLLEVTMKVTVKSQQLKEKLRAENISVIEMDGESLFTRAATQQEQTRDAAAIVAEALRGLPANLISSAANIGQAEVEESSGTATVKVPITVDVNMDAYRKFIGDFKKTLTDLGFKGETVNRELDIGYGDFAPIRVGLGDDLREKFWGKNPYDSPPAYVIAICEMFSLESNQARFTFFKVPKNVLETFAVVPNYVEIKTELYDGGQSLITSQNVKLTKNPKDNSGNSDESDRGDIVSLKLPFGGGNDSKFGMAVISPALRVIYIAYSHAITFGQKGYAPATLEAAFVLSSDELKAAKSIQTNAQNGEVPAK